MHGRRLYEQAIYLDNVLQLTISLAQVSIRDFGYFDLNLCLQFKTTEYPHKKHIWWPLHAQVGLPFLSNLTDPVTAPARATRRLVKDGSK